MAKINKIFLKAKNWIFLHLPIMFNVKAKTNFVSLTNQNYMIATGFLE